MLPQLQIIHVEYFTVPLRTRFPFRYGIAAMEEVPHLLVHAKVLVDGRPVSAWASDNLPPKWFTKNPATTFAEDLPQLVEVIRHAFALACGLSGKPRSFFALWQEVYARQHEWAAEKGHARLLAGFGVSFVERVLLHGLCQATKHGFHSLAMENQLGVRLEACDATLAGLEPRMALPRAPLSRIGARHTVGLSDALTTGDLRESERVNDGLPQSLEDCISAYGLRWFKIKLGGNKEHDHERLIQLTRLLGQSCQDDYRITLDGNEQFGTMAHFREHWEEYQGDPRLSPLMERVYFVEQPLHRDFALQEKVGDALRNWPSAPPLIIDESESGLGDCARALELGYKGCSHKNCKGITKSLVNAALLKRHPGSIHSAEDLTNTGPVSLLQDLAVVAALGIPHAERNGHHYFRGLQFYSKRLQAEMIETHGELYEWREGIACVRIQGGELDVASINGQPMGLGLDLEEASREWEKLELIAQPQAKAPKNATSMAKAS